MSIDLPLRYSAHESGHLRQSTASASLRARGVQILVLILVLPSEANL